METSSSTTRPVSLTEVGERLAPLRLCDEGALRRMGESLSRHGQLSALTVFVADEGLQILDGFKRVRAARALGWPTLYARVDEVCGVEAKLRLMELHAGRGLSELEEGWLVRSLHREDGLSQPQIAERMGRHKSWVWRRLMLVESLEDAVQGQVRLGLLSARAAVAVSRLPRGNQAAASQVVIRRGLTVRQADLLVAEVLAADTVERPALLARRLESAPTTPRPGARVAHRGGLDERRRAAPARGRGAALRAPDVAPAAELARGRGRARRGRPATDPSRAAFTRRGDRARHQPRGARAVSAIGWSSREELVHRVVTLSQAKMSQRAIARATGISRNTVRAILEAHAEGRDVEHLALEPPPARAPRPTKLDPHKPRVAELLTTFPDITAQRVFEILCAEDDFEGSYTGVKRYVGAVRPPPRPTPSLRTPDYGPGEMAESDWSPYEVAFTHAPKAIVQAFSYVLVSSARKFFDVFESNDLFALMDGHVEAFERFEGCAEQCKYDSQKPVVLRWEGQQPIYNPRFLAFSTHYGFRPFAVRRGKPNDKPRVERSFWELERSFFNGRRFRDFEDLHAQLAHWMSTIADVRVLRGSTALERFSEEKPHLRPLPRHPYDTARVAYRVCSVDGFVSWRSNRYAVPYEHVTDLLPVRITQRELFVYAADLRCVARHELAPRGAGQDVDPNQLHPPPQRRSALDLDQIRTAYEAIGEGGAEFFRLVSLGPPRVWGAQVRQILLLRERFRTDELERALAHAAAYGALTFDAVERILAARCAPRTLDEYVAEDTAKKLAEQVGQSRTEPRDLTEYDRLPLSAGEESPCPDDDAKPPTTTSKSSSEDTSDSSDSA